jgi:hypothetical protein
MENQLAFRPGAAGPFDRLLNEIPEEDRAEFAGSIYAVVRMYRLRPGFIGSQFNVFVPNYNGNVNIHSLVEQIENFYERQRAETVALIGSTSRELAAAAAAGRRVPQAPPAAMDDVPLEHLVMERESSDATSSLSSASAGQRAQRLPVASPRTHNLAEMVPQGSGNSAFGSGSQTPTTIGYPLSESTKQPDAKPAANEDPGAKENSWDRKPPPGGAPPGMGGGRGAASI